MFHEMDISDEEPDFTQGNLNCNSNPPAEEEIEECDRLPKKYTLEDIISVERDPNCRPDWFLATYWPVYVANFKVEEWVPDTWHEQISNYFAYYGLLTRMIYVNDESNDPQFTVCQRRCMLIDMLVYFTSKSDAERAIATCHRDSYYGYKLTVLPGRDPVFFNNQRSIRVMFSDQGKFAPLVTKVENALTMFGTVCFAGRYPDDIIIVEFASIPDMIAAVSSQFRWRPVPLKQAFMKQRFLEDDVKMKLEWAKESEPTFMDMQPKPSVLVQLLEGRRPSVSTLWKGHTSYVKAPALQKRSLTWRNRERKMIIMASNKIEKPKKPETDIVSRDPPLPPAKTKRQKEADNIVAVNWFLRQHGAPPISRTTVRELQDKVLHKK